MSNSSAAPTIHHRADLQRVARQAMLDRGLLPDFAPAALRQLDALRAPPAQPAEEVRDLRDRLWCSIDNDDSRDLDQLTVAEVTGGITRILVAIADVDALVARGTPLDDHAAHNTTSVYTPAQIFPMLPERLSTDLTSLNAQADRLSLIIEYGVDADGTLANETVYRAVVRNQAKLAYAGVAAWLEGTAAMPPALAGVPGLAEQLQVQDAAATRLRRLRQEQGALEFESLQATPVFQGEAVVALRADRPDRAKRLIEDFMIAANGVVARFLAGHNRPALRRVVRSPERWQAIVTVAGGYGERLPAEPSAPALEAFLARRRAADPLRFPDLSLVVVKLMGAGEYVVDIPGQASPGHFGLAVKDYSHATAPNRRFPDLVTQRLVKAALLDVASPYDAGTLGALAVHCTQQEGNATKVERQVRKSAAALLLEGRINESFDGIITGVSDKGTYVRLLAPPVEGRVIRRGEGARVGDKVRVTLVGTNFDRGYLDFERR